MSRSTIRTVACQRKKRDANSEPMITEPLEQPPQPSQPKWQLIVSKTIGELSLSILRGPRNEYGQWIPGSCGFFARLSSPSSWSSNIKIDKQIVTVLGMADKQNKTQEGETINELFTCGKDTVKITKPNVAADVHVFKNNRYIFSISEMDLDEILWWVKLMNYIRSHQDVFQTNEEDHVAWKKTAKAYIETVVKLLVLQPHEDGACECSSDACKPPNYSVVSRKGKIITPAEEQRCLQFNALFVGTQKIPLEDDEKATRKEAFRKQLNQAVEIINKSCNWEIDNFGTAYNPLVHQDWEMDDKQLSTVISEVLHRDKKFLEPLEFHLKTDW